MHYGFTGTRKGMTERQRKSVASLLSLRINQLTMGEPDFADWLHHGLCIGADAEAHLIGRELGMKIEGHPSTNPAMQVDLVCDRRRRPKPYLVRDLDLVIACAELIAAPATMVEQRRGSGTWATVRMARRERRLISIIYPDGSYAFSP